MQDGRSGGGAAGGHERNGKTGSPVTVAATPDTEEPSGQLPGAEPSGQLPGSPPGAGSGPGARRSGVSRVVRLVAYAAAGALALGAGFGIARVIQTPGAAAISSAIPSPPKGPDIFVEDDDGTAQDNQTNIVQTTGPGLVHLVSAGTAVGIGMVLTPSGKMLTTYVPSRGAGSLTARYVLSGKTFKVRVIGTDAAAGLALLQLQGGVGQAFPTLRVGNSATLVDAAYAAKQLSYHVPGEVDDTAVGTSGTQDALAINVGTLSDLNVATSVGGTSRTGLLESALQSSAAAEMGGPLVDLNGRVIGITVAGGGSGLHFAGYAIPINQALAIAKQLDARAKSAS